MCNNGVTTGEMACKLRKMGYIHTMRNDTKFIRQQAFDVFSRQSLHTYNLFPSREMRLIDTVFYSEHVRVTVEEVRRSLIDHDGYPADIVVRKAR